MILLRRAALLARSRPVWAQPEAHVVAALHACKPLAACSSRGSNSMGASPGVSCQEFAVLSIKRGPEGVLHARMLAQAPAGR